MEVQKNVGLYRPSFVNSSDIEDEETISITRVVNKRKDLPRLSQVHAIDMLMSGCFLCRSEALTILLNFI